MCESGYMSMRQLRGRESFFFLFSLGPGIFGSFCPTFDRTVKMYVAFLGRFILMFALRSSKFAREIFRCEGWSAGWWFRFSMLAGRKLEFSAGWNGCLLLWRGRLGVLGRLIGVYRLQLLLLGIMCWFCRSYTTKRISRIMKLEVVYGNFAKQDLRLLLFVIFWNILNLFKFFFSLQTTADFYLCILGSRTF